MADFGELAKNEAKMEQQRGEEKDQGAAPNGMTATGERWWCPMTIKQPPRPNRFPSKMRSRSWKPTDQGTVLRYVQRYCSGDGTIFAAKGQKPGGCTVLIDASGSMRFSAEEILQVMQLMPAALIAAYDGDDTKGELRILAKKGRRVDSHHFKGPVGGNAVDGPALEWLSKQAGPRYWVSDGHIVGYRGARTPAMYAAVYKTCRDANILRVDGLSDVIAKFSDGTYRPRGRR
jgi:hypothetical protein